MTTNGVFRGDHTPNVDVADDRVRRDLAFRGRADTRGSPATRTPALTVELLGRPVVAHHPERRGVRPVTSTPRLEMIEHDVGVTAMVGPGAHEKTATCPWATAA